MSLKSSISIAALTVALLAGPAHSSDLNGSVKDGGNLDTPSVVSWSGVYIGGAVGYGNANHDLTVQNYNGDYCFDKSGTSTATQPSDPTNPFNAWGNTLTNVPTGGCTGTGNATVDASSKDVANLDGLNSHGVVGDVRLGYDMAFGRFLGGVYGSFGFSGMETTGGIAGLGTLSIEKGDEWSIGARAGVIVAPRTLAYILAAYTQTEYEFGVTGAGGGGGSKDVTFEGVTVGGGIEFALMSNVFLGVEGTHTFYGEETIIDSGASPVGGFGTRLNDDLDETKIMGTLKIKLNGFGR